MEKGVKVKAIELIAKYELKVECYPRIVYVRREGRPEVGVRYRNTDGDASAAESAVETAISLACPEEEK